MIESTSIKLNKMHVDFGNNPFDASLEIKNLKDYALDMNVKGQMNLVDLNKMLPIDGLEIAGDLDLDLSAKGVYDGVNQIIPVLDMRFALENGEIKSDQMPSSLNGLTLKATILNSTSLIADTEIEVEKLEFEMDGQPFSAVAKVINPLDARWTANIKGILDIEKLMALYPLEGMHLEGTVIADVSSIGTMKAIESAQYGSLNTSGSFELSNFVYEDELFDQQVSIIKAVAAFFKDQIAIKALTGKAGKTAFEMEGTVSNYLGFALNDEKLLGDILLEADVLDINEWMTSSTEVETTTDDEAAVFEVVRIPENINFTAKTRVDKVIYQDISMSNLAGQLEVVDGKIHLKNTSFNTLGGEVILKGGYNSVPESPTFEMDFSVKKLEIPQAFNSVKIVQKLAPIAQNMTGDFSSTFKLNGTLDTEMMPVYSGLTGAGFIEIAKANLGQTPITEALASVSSLSNVSQASLEKVKMVAEIKEGRLFVNPFPLKFGDYAAELGGSTGVDGSVDYTISLDIPENAIGNQLSGILANLSNNQLKIDRELVLNLGLVGTYNKPQFIIRGVKSKDGEALDEMVTATIEAKIEEEKKELEEKLEAEVQVVKDSVNEKADEVVEVAKDSANTLVQAQIDSVLSKQLGANPDSLSTEEKLIKTKAEDLIKGLFKKKKKKKKIGTGGK